MKIGLKIKQILMSGFMVCLMLSSLVAEETGKEPPQKSLQQAKAEAQATIERLTKELKDSKDPIGTALAIVEKKDSLEFKACTLYQLFADNPDDERSLKGLELLSKAGPHFFHDLETVYGMAAQLYEWRRDEQNSARIFEMLTKDKKPEEQIAAMKEYIDKTVAAGQSLPNLLPDKLCERALSLNLEGSFDIYIKTSRYTYAKQAIELFPEKILEYIKPKSLQEIKKSGLLEGCVLAKDEKIYNDIKEKLLQEKDEEMVEDVLLSIRFRKSDANIKLVELFNRDEQRFILGAGLRLIRTGDGEENIAVFRKRMDEIAVSERPEEEKALILEKLKSYKDQIKNKGVQK